MGQAAAGMLAVLYCCVFFLKKTKQKIALLFSVDTLVLAVLLATGTAAGATAIFILSAAAVNTAVFFMPAEKSLPVLGLKDFAVICVNIIVAALAAVFVIRNPGQGAGHAAALNPAIAAFIFMTLSGAGYFMVSAVTGEKK
jgi:hypothetical protein